MTTSEGRIPIRRALVSVYDKEGLEELARGLHQAGVSIVSTGGSAALIESLAIPVTKVEELTGFPECLDGRVKTLHPKVHAGILADRRLDSHNEQLQELGVEPFDLVVSNLYPFSQTVASGATADECVEQIDIGGPSMVRAAAKNHPSVAIVTSPADYAAVLTAVQAGGFTLAERRRLATDAFVHTATYDVNVATWMGSELNDHADAQFADWIGASWGLGDVLRYGENPHQRAAVYRNGHGAARGLAQGSQLHGKEMSYNNYIDADAAYRAAYDHGDQPTVAIIKHANPCGIAIGETVAEAHRKAHECDPVSAYGGIIATNRPVTAEMAETVKDIFTEVIVAPGFEGAALDILTAKKNLRLLVVDPPTGLHIESRPITGGMLVQSRDQIDAEGVDAEGRPFGDSPANWRLVAGEVASDEVLADLAFAWRSVRAVKSNAILLAHGGASVGVGMGQVNRVDSCHLAVNRAGERAKGAVASSDAFFPFADGLQVLIDGGVKAVVAPGGSIRDEEVIAAANAAGITLYFTGTRHFAH
ncbi:bifunctional phosphoribosylaminoimidazolecarboxamide formyltransferase/IMP cyclohydrolase [Nocardioides alcanivorans]|uniref:bifunctional phosphoribosylaminoimidazolecarboxamide formyltransferase/IMP cyclohydrolase n=1 Tax=Nocardioides alcanivorans TaxID=2897352 RepID=UPI001F462C2C|nr:bifunctional phosphoribosylaminoimidazolecarboxamide formyltransferase/IMP cyclohydrolase [Nocardioides alcanivorans]